MNAHRRLLICTAALLTALALAACEPDPGPEPLPDAGVGDAPIDSTDIPAVARRLAAQRAAWEAEDIDHYRYTYVPRCFCPPSRIAIEVEAGSARVLGISGDSLFATRLIDPGVPTIDSLFARLARAAEEEPAEMRVRYDPTYDYPVESWIDVDRMMADEEWGFEVDSFAVLNGSR